jgi:hypothetical protein
MSKDGRLHYVTTVTDAAAELEREHASLRPTSAPSQATG